MKCITSFVFLFAVVQATVKYNPIDYSGIRSSRNAPIRRQVDPNIIPTIAQNSNLANQRESTPPLTSTVSPNYGCESCVNSKLTIGDTWVGQCFPQRSSNPFGRCTCLCADTFCRDGEKIDRSTCVNGGHINECKCIGSEITMTTASFK